MKLQDKMLKDQGINLTTLEKETLDAILGQGSFFEEAGGNQSEDNAFIGWEIYESEVKGCRGALASLEKKGIIDIEEDEDGVAYYINYGLTFKNNGYHEIEFE